MQKKKVVYIAHPISGDINDNLFSIRKIVRHLNLSRNDIVPFVPYYVDVVSLDDNNPAERDRGIQNDIALFERGIIDEVWLYGNRISKGMQAEILLANSMNIPIRPQTKVLEFELEKLLESIGNYPELQEN
ncbi:MAG: hypothetical protein QM768_21670 [Agriterribacter sp.]